jgi:SAM-dependent methyltransferase
MLDPTRRFSNRVEEYIRYRPRYPREAIDLLVREAGITERSRIADVGAGTGILTEPLLETGATVYAIEPNREMREAAGELLDGHRKLILVDGTAESTGLFDGGIDLVVAAQAFHWFDRRRARDEFVRILRPGGLVALLWNVRRLDATPFLQEYEELLRRFAPEYVAVGHQHKGEEEIEEFFHPSGYRIETMENLQEFDFEGLQGRLLSSSYAPMQGSPGHEPMIEALRALFDRNQQNGKIRFEYDTKIYYGRPEDESRV